MTHHCHAIGCEIAVPPELLMCRDHWWKVPAHVRSQVWSHYRKGQCDDRRPSGQWMIAATRAICAVAVKEGVLTQEQAQLRIAREIESFTSVRRRTRLVNIRPSSGRSPHYDVYIGRGSPYGNPFSHAADSKFNVVRVKTREEAVAAYRLWINLDDEIPGWTKPTHDQLMVLRGKILGCYCDPLPCHGEVIIDYIEAEEASTSFADVSSVPDGDSSERCSDASEGTGGGTDPRRGAVLIGSRESGRPPANSTRSEVTSNGGDPKEDTDEKGHQAETEDSVLLTSALSPPLRWPGGKRWLIEKLVPEILACRPTLYIEPFLGAGAIALALPAGLPKVLGDASEPLINLWHCIQETPRLVDSLVRMIYQSCGNTKDGYLLARDHFNSLEPPLDTISALERAALMLYLNATSYNGVWRENRRGKYNVPFGRVKKPALSTGEELTEISQRLARASIVLSGYDVLLRGVLSALGSEEKRHLVIYADPPYFGGFDDYLAGGFDDEQHRDLAERLHEAAAMGVKVFATNSNTEFIRSIYSWASLEVIEESRNVAQKTTSRKAVPCLLIRGD